MYSPSLVLPEYAPRFTDPPEIVPLLLWNGNSKLCFLWVNSVTGPCSEVEGSGKFRSGRSIERETQSVAKEIIRMIKKPVQRKGREVERKVSGGGSWC